MMKMNIRNIVFILSGLTFCLVLHSLAYEVDSEGNLNVASLCDKFNGTVDLRQLNHAILKYEEILPMECKILFANTYEQYVVFSFYYWDVKGNDTLVFRDRFTELSLIGKFAWFGDKTVLFRGPTTFHFSMKDIFYSTRMNSFKFLYTVSYMGFSGCNKYDFSCNNKICLNESDFICDGNNNCGDWSDEIDCERTCTDNEFKCANEKCVPNYQLCNNKNNCGDMSDEKMCNKDCRKRNQYKCNNTICISRNQVCDNTNDCGDWSDEVNCGKDCKLSYQFKCNNNICISRQQVCDNKNDCEDWSDEVNCDVAGGNVLEEKNKSMNPWYIAITICAVLLAIIVVTFFSTIIRNIVADKKKKARNQLSNSSSNSGVHHVQSPNLMERFRRSFRSGLQTASPSTIPPVEIQPTTVISEPQIHQVPSMYPQLQSNVDSTDVHHVQPPSLLERVRQSFRSGRQSTTSSIQPSEHTYSARVNTGEETYQVPSMYPELQSGLDNPEFKIEE